MYSIQLQMWWGGAWPDHIGLMGKLALVQQNLQAKFHPNIKLIRSRVIQMYMYEFNLSFLTPTHYFADFVFSIKCVYPLVSMSKLHFVWCFSQNRRWFLYRIICSYHREWIYFFLIILQNEYVVSNIRKLINHSFPGGEPTKVKCNYIRANVITFAQI